MSKFLSNTKLLEILDDWWEDEQNMKGGLIRALMFKGKKDKAKEVIKEFGERESAYKQLREMIILDMSIERND